jgi:peptidoglycan-associated lipoprotein
MALGERRVQTVFAYLSQLGVPVGRMSTISYGELRPLDPRENEAAWARNRRVSFTFPPEVRN